MLCEPINIDASSRSILYTKYYKEYDQELCIRLFDRADLFQVEQWDKKKYRASVIPEVLWEVVAQSCSAQLFVVEINGNLAFVAEICKAEQYYCDEIFDPVPGDYCVSVFFEAADERVHQYITALFEFLFNFWEVIRLFWNIRYDKSTFGIHKLPVSEAIRVEMMEESGNGLLKICRQNCFATDLLAFLNQQEDSIYEKNTIETSNAFR